MDALTVVIAGLGVVTTVAVGWVTHWDATRVGVSRPRLWTAITAGTVAIGFGLYLFAPAPMTGVLLTANTGPVLYTFEREITTEDDETAEPGTLPGGPRGRDRDDVD